MDLSTLYGLPGGSVVRNMPANAGDAEDMGSSPGSGRYPEGRRGNPLQYSCLENSMDRGSVLCLVGYSPQDHKELDVTEHAVTHPPVQAAWILLVFPRGGLPKENSGQGGTEQVKHWFL